jgi:predicted outer membrane lipoprotein
VNGAAANIIINAMRQEHPTRAAAERAFDDLFGRMKALLLDHYDASGRKKGVFPYTQVVQPLLLLDKDKMNGG